VADDTRQGDDPTGDRSQLLRDIRDLLRKLPDQMVVKMAGGPGGGLFPGGAPAGGGTGPDEKETSPGRAKVKGYENLGFALGRFVPTIGQVAGLSRDIRNVMDAWKGLMGTEEQVAPVPPPHMLSERAGQIVGQQQEQQQEPTDLKPPDWKRIAAGPGYPSTSGKSYPEPSGSEFGKAQFEMEQEMERRRWEVGVPPGPPPGGEPGSLPGRPAGRPMQGYDPRGALPPPPLPAWPPKAPPTQLGGVAAVPTVMPQAPLPMTMSAKEEPGKGRDAGNEVPQKLDKIAGLLEELLKVQKDQASNTDTDETENVENWQPKGAWQEVPAAGAAGLAGAAGKGQGLGSDMKPPERPKDDGSLFKTLFDLAKIAAGAAAAVPK